MEITILLTAQAALAAICLLMALPMLGQGCRRVVGVPFSPPPIIL